MYKASLAIVTKNVGRAMLVALIAIQLVDYLSNSDWQLMLLALLASLIWVGSDFYLEWMDAIERQARNHLMEMRGLRNFPLQGGEHYPSLFNLDPDNKVGDEIEWTGKIQ